MTTIQKTTRGLVLTSLVLVLVFGFVSTARAQITSVQISQIQSLLDLVEQLQAQIILLQEGPPAEDENEGDSTSNETPAPEGIDACAGDGVTDDSDCLYSVLRQGGTIDFPADKTYLVRNGAFVYSDTTINGNGSTILTKTATSALRVQGDNITISGLRIVSERDAPMIATGININGDTNNLTLRNNFVSAPKVTAAIKVGGANVSDITIEGNTVDGAIYAIFFNTPRDLGSKAAYPNNIVVSNNTIKNAMDGIQFNSPIFQHDTYGGSGVPGVAMHNITVSKNYIDVPGDDSYQDGYCISFAGVVDAQAWGNTMVNCKWQGVHIEDKARNIAIAGNHIRNVVGATAGSPNLWTNYWSGIWATDSDNVHILNNTIENTPHSGIEFVWGAGADIYMRDSSISGNTIRDYGEYGIYIAGPSSADMNIYVGPNKNYPDNTIDDSGMAPSMVEGNQGDPGGINWAGAYSPF